MVEGEQQVYKNNWQSVQQHVQNNYAIGNPNLNEGIWRNNRTGKLWAAKEATGKWTDPKTGELHPALTMIGTDARQRQSVPRD